MFNEVIHLAAGVKVLYRNSSGIRRKRLRSDPLPGLLSSVVRRRIRLKFNIVMRKAS